MPEPDITTATSAAGSTPSAHPPEASIGLTPALLVTALETEGPGMLQQLMRHCPTETLQSPLGMLFQATEQRLSRHYDEASRLLDICEPHLDGLCHVIGLFNRMSIASACLTPDAQIRLQQLRDAAPAEWVWLTGKIHWFGGYLAHIDGDRETARRQWEQAASCFQACGGTQPLLKIYSALTALHINAGAFAEAASHVDRAFDVARSAAVPPPHELYENKAYIALWSMKPDEALRWYERGIVLAADSGNVYAENRLRTDRIWARLIAGDLPGADADLAIIADHWAESGQPTQLIEYGQAAAMVSLCRSDLPAARKALDHAGAFISDGMQSLQRSGYDRVRALLAARLADWPTVREIAAANVDAHADLPAVQAVFLDLLELAESQSGTSETVARVREQLAAACRTLRVDPAYLRRVNLLAPTPANRPTVRCFGGIDVLDAQGNGLLSRRQATRLREVLALLILEPNGLTADELSDRLALPLQSAKGAAMAVSRLRQTLTNAGLSIGAAGVVVLQGRYRLAPEVRQACPYDHFETARLAAATAADPSPHYQRMVQLYDGPLMAGLENAHWLILPQQTCWAHWLQAVTWLGRRALETGTPATAIELADRALRVDPNALTLHRLMLEALLQSENDGPALAKRHWAALQAWYGTQTGDDAMDDLTAWWQAQG